MRARHRAWIEFSSAVLNGIATLYNAPDTTGFHAASQSLHDCFRQIEATLGQGPWFAGADFSLVDAAFGPVFRYFDVLDQIGDFGVFAEFPKLAAWRRTLSARPSVQGAVAADYPARLRAFFAARPSYLASLVTKGAPPAHIAAFIEDGGPDHAQARPPARLGG